MLIDIKDYKDNFISSLESLDPTPHDFFYKKLGISIPDRFEFIKKCFSNFNQIEEKTFKKNIPSIVHRMWLTDPYSPYPPPDEYIEKINNHSLELGSEFEFIFWHNSDQLAKDLMTKVASQRINFCNINELNCGNKIKNSISNAINLKKYVLAGDITKYMLIWEYGGFYGDLGIFFDSRIVKLSRSVDLMLQLGENLFFQPAFMAAIPKHPFFTSWKCLLEQPELILSFVFDDFDELTYGHEIWLHGGVSFTAALLLLNQSEDVLLPIFSNKGLIHHTSLASWYGNENKFGNVRISADVRASLFDNRMFKFFKEKSNNIESFHNQNYKKYVGSIILETISKKLNYNSF